MPASVDVFVDRRIAFYVAVSPVPIANEVGDSLWDTSFQPSELQSAQIGSLCHFRFHPVKQNLRYSIFGDVYWTPEWSLPIDEVDQLQLRYLLGASSMARSVL